MDSTVISDAVNLSSRLEGLSKVYGASVVISEAVLARLEDPSRYQYRFLDRVKVKGKTQNVSVFEIFGGEVSAVRNLKQQTRDSFEKGIQHYHNGEFVRAASSFEEVLQQNPQDKAAIYYMKRAAHYMVNKPPPDWESAEVMGSK